MDYSKSNTIYMSEDVRAITQSMLDAMVGFEKTGLEGENNHQKYNYAKLPQIYNAVKKALHENKIKIVHGRFVMEGVEYLRTRLIHATTGQFFEDICILESEKPGNQAKASANTYMRKQAVLSLCAIHGEDDDDGEDEEKYIENTKPVNTLQYTELCSAIRNNPTTMKDSLFKATCRKYNVVDLKLIPTDKCREALQFITNWKE